MYVLVVSVLNTRGGTLWGSALLSLHARAFFPILCSLSPRCLGLPECFSLPPTRGVCSPHFSPPSLHCSLGTSQPVSRGNSRAPIVCFPIFQGLLSPSSADTQCLENHCFIAVAFWFFVFGCYRPEGKSSPCYSIWAGNGNNPHPFFFL